MSVSINGKAWCTSFSNCAMVVFTFDACPFCFLFSILVNRVRSIVLLAGGVSVFCVQDLVLCSSGILFIIVLCLFFSVFTFGYF